MRDLLLTQGGRIFVVVWIGQLVSTLGSTLVGFAVGLWVLAETGSTMSFALVLLSNKLPLLLATPVAGVVVDRWDRRKVMLLSDAGAAIGTLGAALLFATGTASIWYLMGALAFSGTFQAFQQPAYAAATTLLVPKEQLPRAAGMVQLAGSIGSVAGPTAAVMVMEVSGMMLVFVLDFVSFALAASLLLTLSFPELQQRRIVGSGLRSWLGEGGQGVSFIRQREGLSALFVALTIADFCFGALSVLLLPLLLGVTSEVAAGFIVSGTAVALVIGSGFMTVRRAPSNTSVALFSSLVVVGIGFVITGSAPIVWVAAVGLTVIHLVYPITMSLTQAIWQTSVPPQLQGRVFALRQAATATAIPVAVFMAALLADSVFEPLMANQNRFSDLVGRAIGTGPGRGVALMFIITGIALILTVLITWSTPGAKQLSLNDNEGSRSLEVNQPVAS